MSDQKPAEANALVRAGDVRHADEIVITSPAEFKEALALFTERQAHILTPMVDVGQLPPHYKLIPAVTLVNPNPASGDVYVDRLFCSDGEVALAKPALRRILSAGGFSIHTERVDPRTIDNYWEFRCTLSYRGLDGQPRTLDATADYDLRDGSARIGKMKASAARAKPPRSADSQIEGARQYGLRGCEARAVNAAARELGLRQKYAAKDLARPFVQFVPVHNPDMTNPDVVRMVTADALQNAKLLSFASPTAGELPAHNVVGEVDERTGALADEDAPAGVPFDESDEKDAEQPEASYEIAGVFKVDDKAFYLLTKELGPNTRLTTDDPTLARQANVYKKAGTRVHLTLDRGAILEMRAAK